MTTTEYPNTMTQLQATRLQSGVVGTSALEPFGIPYGSKVCLTYLRSFRVAPEGTPGSELVHEFYASLKHGDSLTCFVRLEHLSSVSVNV